MKSERMQLNAYAQSALWAFTRRGQSIVIEAIWGVTTTQRKVEALLAARERSETIEAGSNQLPVKV